MITHIRMLIGSLFLFLQSLFSFPKIDSTIYNIKEEIEETTINDTETEQFDKTIMSYNIHSGFDFRYNFKINELKVSLKNYSENINDKVTKIKLEEVVRLLKEIDKNSKINNDDLINLLQYYELTEELSKVK